MHRGAPGDPARPGGASAAPPCPAPSRACWRSWTRAPSGRRMWRPFSARLSNATRSRVKLPGRLGLPDQSGGRLPRGARPDLTTAPFPTTCRAARPRCWRGCPRSPRRRPAGPRRPFWGYWEDIFTLSAQGEGRLPTWGFSALVNGGELYVEVTRQGGQVLPGALPPRPVGEA